MKIDLTTRVLQLALLNAASAAFVFLAGAAGWVYTRGAEADLLRWLPVITIGNGFVVAAFGAGPNRGPLVRRLLTWVVMLGLTGVAWFVVAFVARSLFYWPSTFAAVAGQMGSFLAMLIISIRQLGDGEAAEARDRALADLRDRLERVERDALAKKRKKRK